MKRECVSGSRVELRLGAFRKVANQGELLEEAGPKKGGPRKAPEKAPIELQPWRGGHEAGARKLQVSELGC